MFCHVTDPRLNKIQNQTLKSIEINNMRFYRISENNWVPSVTTVVNYSKRDFFKEWEKKSPDNAAKKIRAVDRGNQLHSAIELLLTRQYDSVVGALDDKWRPLFSAAYPTLKRIDNILSIETGLFSEKLKLAGRVDCIAEFDGVLSIIDFKGSETPKPEKYLNGYYQQASAYAIMFQEMTGIPVNQLVIIVICENGIIQVKKKKVVDYILPLHETIENFWNEYEGNDII